MSIRDNFVARFGEEEARRLEWAAAEHSNGINDQNKGLDTFKWVLLICIGYGCFQKDRFRKYHGIVAPYEDLRYWIKHNADLGSHDGDYDYFGLLMGTYNEYMKET